MTVTKQHKMAMALLHGFWIILFMSLGVYVDTLGNLQGNLVQVLAMVVSFVTFCLMPFKILKDMKQSFKRV